jgi:hypothetical protein
VNSSRSFGRTRGQISKNTASDTDVNGCVCCV